MKKWHIGICGIVTGLLIIAGIYAGNLTLTNKKETIHLSPVIKYIKYDYAVPSEYNYYNYLNYTNDSFIQAACKWIHYWDKLHTNTTSLNIKYKNTIYANANISWIPIVPTGLFYGGEINIIYHRNIGYLQKIRAELDISDGYEYYLKGYIDNVGAYVGPIEINGRGYNKSNNPTLKEQDTSYFYATKFGKNLKAYLECNILKEDRNQRITNLSIIFSLAGPGSYYKVHNLNTTLNITMNTVYKNKIIISKITYHFNESFVKWSLPEPKIYSLENLSVGEEVILNLTPSIDKVDEYFIFWGDCNVSSIPKHTYAQPGNYTICAFYKIGKDLSFIAKKEVVVK